MEALVIQNLSKTYKSGVPALQSVSFEVEQGDFFALLGPNGAGKSTLIGILTSLVLKTAGKVFINGIDIDKDFSKAKSFVGVVPQDFNFGTFDKVINIVVDQAGYYGIPRGIALKRAEKYLKQLELWDKRNTVSRFLSGGMKRRLMIARAMMHHPKILILDEPTAGVDIQIRRAMWRFLQKINAQEGVTIILTTHYLEEAEQLCRHIAIIDHGTIIEHTTMNNLLAQLNTESFILYLTQPVKELINIPKYPIQLLDPYTLEVKISKSQDITDLFDVLKKQGVFVSRLRNKSNRLEEIFIQMTKNKDEH